MKGKQNNYHAIKVEEHDLEHLNHKEEEEEPKVSTLELFSDLVIVVSIHVVAEPLEEEDFTQYGMYFARVFYLWLSWHTITLFMNAAVKMKSNNCPVYNFVIFIWMACILHMSQSFSVDDDRTALKWYLILRVYSIFQYARAVYFPYKAIELPDGTRALSVEEGTIDEMQKFVHVMMFTVSFCEFVPLFLAYHWGSDGQLYYPMVRISICMIILSMIASATFGNRGKIMVNTFDTDHLQERYELITLIFTGELCFAAGKPGNIVGTYAVMCMAFCCYLLTFKAHPPRGHVKFWARSTLHSVVGLFLYAGVFCAIPAMGSAFARIIDNKDAAGEGMENTNTETNAEWNEEEIIMGISAGDLLCYSAGTFMTFSAMLNVINVDPKGHMQPKICSYHRGLIRIFFGFLMWASVFLIPEEARFHDAPLTAILIPVFAFLSTAIEIWAVGSLKIAL